MNSLLTAFEVIALVAVGGSLLAMAAFEISDALVDHKRINTLNRKARAVVARNAPLTSARPASLTIDSLADNDACNILSPGYQLAA